MNNLDLPTGLKKFIAIFFGALLLGNAFGIGPFSKVVTGNGNRTASMSVDG